MMMNGMIEWFIISINLVTTNLSFCHYLIH